ncbi:MBG domain-containing protein [Mucilaginibacter sp.]|uniref:MBG domain-containing protein n=1 Tax=Mucilaginibacter sp. TaxID=1882438 RepID=UPI002ED59A58
MFLTVPARKASLFLCIFLFFSASARRIFAQASQTVANGQGTAAITFPSGSCTYNWVNDNPSIGLAASGTGNIASFTAVNTGSTPVTATITATPANPGFAYIANGGFGVNSVSVIDIAAKMVTATIPVGANPWGVAVNHAGTLVYVGNPSGNKSISVINTATNTVSATIPVNGEAGNMLVSADDSKLYVADYPYITVINTINNTVISDFTLGNYITPTGIALSPDGSKLYVANGSNNDILVVNTITHAIMADIAIGYNPFGIALSPDGSRLYAPYGVRTIFPDINNNDILKVINTADNTVSASIPVGQGAIIVALNNDGSRAYVINSFSNSVSVINTAVNQVIATVPVGNGPIGLSVTGDGSEVLVENGRDNNVSVINTATNTVTATIATGEDPNSYGNFITQGAACGGGTISFKITVNPTPVITASPVTGEIAACVGTASASPALELFSVAGNNLTGNIQVAAPANFEIALTSAGTYGNKLTLVPVGGKVIGTTIYVRSAATAKGNISGNVNISSPGTNNLDIPISGSVKDIQTINTVSDQTVMNGQFTNAITFTGTANTVNWTNDMPAVGLSAKGSGNIPAFKTVNFTATPIVANITATPSPSVYAYINNSGDGTVSVVNTANNKIENTITVGSTPIGVTSSPDGRRIYVENEDSNTISVISTNSNTVIATIPVGPYARGGLVVSPDGSTLYLATFGGNNVLVINAITNTVTASIPVGKLPVGIAVSPDGSKVYTGNFGDGKISVINTSTNTVASSITIDPLNNSLAVMDILVSPDGRRLYAVTQSPDMVYSIEAATGTILSKVPIGLAGVAIALSPDGNTLYAISQHANTVTVINTIANQILATIPISGDPAGIAVSPDGSQAFVTSPTGIAVINTISNTVTSTFLTGNSPHSFGNFIVKSANCLGSPVHFSIKVDPSPPPVISFTGNLPPLNTQYGTPSPSTSFSISAVNLNEGVMITPPSGFEISMDNHVFAPNVTVGAAGTITSIPVFIRIAATSHVGTYSGDIKLSSINAANVKIAMPASKVSSAPLKITGNSVTKSYGSVITGTAGSEAFTSFGLQNNETIGSITIEYGQGATAAATVGNYISSISATAATGGTFNPADYAISYTPGNIIVTAVPLTITADNKVKIYGTINPVLTASYSGFVNGEGPQQLSMLPTIKTAAAQNSAAGQYEITVSDAVAPNYDITYISGLLTIQASHPDIVIPNTFTPNGDGANDKWNISALSKYPKCSVSIFTRYGILLFYSIGYGQAWDGTYHNSPLPVGTYYYIIKVNTTGNINTLSGPVTIIR